MVQINFAQRTVNAKIVYYGPGMSGKTTNLEVIHQRAPSNNRGDLTSISTDGDRTLFFDFMPLDLGTVAGMRTCFQIYTVPGQVYYNSTRKLVLQGVDGVVFVADSSAAMQEENLESMRNLHENLAEYGRSLEDLPLVIQYNKRDLPDALSVEELESLLNPGGAPSYEGVANTGQGVFPTLKALAACVIEHIHKVQQSGSAGGSTSHEPPPGLSPASHDAPSGTLAAEAPMAPSAPEPAPPFAAGGPPPQPAPSRGLELAASAPPAQRVAAAPQAAGDAGSLRLTRPVSRGAESQVGAARPAPPARVAQPKVQPKPAAHAPAAQAGAQRVGARPPKAAAVAPRPRPQAKPHLMKPEPAAAPAARPGVRGRSKAGAPAHPSARSTPVAATAGKRNAVMTALIVAGSVIVGAVIGSVLLSLL